MNEAQRVNPATVRSSKMLSHIDGDEIDVGSLGSDLPQYGTSVGTNYVAVRGGVRYFSQ